MCVNRQASQRMVARTRTLLVAALFSVILLLSRASILYIALREVRIVTNVACLEQLGRLYFHSGGGCRQQNITISAELNDLGIFGASIDEMGGSSGCVCKVQEGSLHVCRGTRGVPTQETMAILALLWCGMPCISRWTSIEGTS